METVATTWLNKVGRGGGGGGGEERERERERDHNCARACVCVWESPVCASVGLLCVRMLWYRLQTFRIHKHTAEWYYVKCGRGDMFCGLVANCIVSVGLRAASSYSPPRARSRSTVIAGYSKQPHSSLYSFSKSRGFNLYKTHWCHANQSANRKHMPLGLGPNLNQIHIRTRTHARTHARTLGLLNSVLLNGDIFQGGKKKKWNGEISDFAVNNHNLDRRKNTK